MTKPQDIDSLKIYLNSLCHDMEVLSVVLIEAMTKEFEDGFQADRSLSISLKTARFCMTKERDRLIRALVKLQKEVRDAQTN